MPPATEFPSVKENSPTMNLGEDVISDILLRLPVRLLLRFKCVSKEWYALISSSLFKDTYLALRRRAWAVDGDEQVSALAITPIDDISRHHRPDDPVDDDEYDEEVGFKRTNYVSRLSVRLSVTCWYGDYQSLSLSALECWYGDYQSLSLSALEPSSSSSSSSSSCNEFEIPGNYSGEIRIINHVNGIVCFVNGDNWFDITLANPALGEIRKLPIPVFDLGGFRLHPLRTGFGYDDVSDDYKVVVIVTVYEEQGFRSPYKHLLIVYRLSTNSWKISGDMSEFVSRPFTCLLTPNESVFSHGSIHWCLGSDIDDDDVPCYWILAFDVTNELFREMPFPLGWSYFSFYDHFDGMFPHIFRVDESTIALVNSTNQSSEYPKLEVWVMNEYGDNDSWTKRCLINNLPGGFRWAISFWKKDKLLLLSTDLCVICYDLLKGQMDEPEQFYPICISGIRGLQLVTGHESFVSVKQVLGEDTLNVRSREPKQHLVSLF